MLIRMFTLAMLPMVLLAQAGSQNYKLENDSNKGVAWLQGLSWTDVLKKAKAEKKYVFVDCYATWCGPCKAMDKNVYPDEKVGEIVNDKFISVKVQMDKTERDNEMVKAWYKDAISLQGKYNIDAYPTLLFFSWDGTILHRVTQGLNIEGFLEVVSTALDPKKRYYSLLAEYKDGKKDTGTMKTLVKAAKVANDKKMAATVAEEYFGTLDVKSLYNKEIRDFVREFGSGVKANQLASHYINSLNEKDFFIKDNIEFLRQFTNSSKDRGFKIFYKYPEKINNIMEGVPLPKGAVSKINKGDYAQSAVRSLIYLEQIYEPVFKPAIDDSMKRNDPDWLNLSLNIHKKYPKVDTERIIIDAKVGWYGWRENWREFSKSLISQMDINYKNKSLSGMTFNINNNCWALFKHAEDSAILNRAIKWMENAFRQNEKDLKWGTAIDTYANLLYKVGRKKEALEWEAKAVECEPKNQEIIQAWDRMKKGLPTWPQ